MAIFIDNLFGSSYGKHIDQTALVVGLNFFKDQGFNIKRQLIIDNDYEFIIELTKEKDFYSREYGAELYKGKITQKFQGVVTKRLQDASALKIKNARSCNINISKLGTLKMASIEMVCDNLYDSGEALTTIELVPNKKKDNTWLGPVISMFSNSLSSKTTDMAVTMAVINFLEQQGFYVLDNNILESENQRKTSINVFK